MKYVILNSEQAILFPDAVSHSSVAQEDQVLSAGFCSVETYRDEYDDIRAKVSVWGDSTTLNRKSDPGDEMIIARMFKTGF